MIVSIRVRVHLKHSNPALPQQYGDADRRAFWEIEAGVSLFAYPVGEPIPAVTGGEAGHILSLSRFYHRAGETKNTHSYRQYFNVYRLLIFVTCYYYKP